VDEVNAGEGGRERDGRKGRKKKKGNPVFFLSSLALIFMLRN